MTESAGGKVRRQVLPHGGCAQPPHNAQQIEYVEPARIRVETPSLRKHGPKNIGTVARLMKEFGFIGSLLVDHDYSLIAGYARLAAAMQLGLERVSVTRISHLTDTQIRAFKIADNKLAEMSSWDEEALARELSFLTAIDFDIGLTGFTVAETGLLIGRVSAKTNATAMDDCPGDPSSPAIGAFKSGWYFGTGDSAGSDSGFVRGRIVGEDSVGGVPRRFDERQRAKRFQRSRTQERQRCGPAFCHRI